MSPATQGGEPVEISRQQKHLSVAVTNSANTTPEIDLTGKAFGSVIIPTAATGVTSLTFYGTDKLGGTYVPIADIGGALSVAVTNGYKIPDNCFGYAAIKIVANVAGPSTLLLVLKG